MELDLKPVQSAIPSEVITKRECNSKLFITTFVLSILSAATMVAGAYLIVYGGTNTLSTFIPGLCLVVGGLAFEISSVVQSCKSCRSKIVKNPPNTTQTPNTEKPSIDQPATIEQQPVQTSETDLIDAQEGTEETKVQSLTPQEFLAQLKDLSVVDCKFRLEGLDEETFKALIGHIDSVSLAENSSITSNILEATASCTDLLSSCSLTNVFLIDPLLKNMDLARCQEDKNKEFITKHLKIVYEKHSIKFEECGSRFPFFPQVLALCVNEFRKVDFDWQPIVSKMDDEKYAEFLNALTVEPIKQQNVNIILRKPIYKNDSTEICSFYSYLIVNPLAFAKGLDSSSPDTKYTVFDLMSEKHKNDFLLYLLNKDEFISQYLQFYASKTEGTIPKASAVALAKYQKILGDLFEKSEALFSVELANLLLLEMVVVNQEFLNKIKKSKKLEVKIEGKKLKDKFNKISASISSFNKIGVFFSELLKHRAQKIIKNSKDLHTALIADNLFINILISSPDKTAIKFLLCEAEFLPEFGVHMLLIHNQTPPKLNLTNEIIKGLDIETFKRLAIALNSLKKANGQVPVQHIDVLIKCFLEYKDVSKILQNDASNNWDDFLALKKKK